MSLADAFRATNRQLIEHVDSAWHRGDMGCHFPAHHRCPRGQQLWDDATELWQRMRMTGRMFR